MMANKTALIMGVANRRSIAWACVRSFLEQDYNVIFTYQNERFQKTAENLIESTGVASPRRNIHALPCNVQSEIPLLFQQRLPELLGNVSLDAIVHSIAYAPDMKESSLLTTRREDFTIAHDISAYSFLEVAQYSNTQSLTALSYLGAVRAVPHYSVMGPCKASLESLVRGLAVELGSRGTRVNAVSSGPLSTLSGRGITGLSSIQADVGFRAPLKRNITADEVADTVRFIATQATGITGQTIYVDGGYSIVAGPIIQS